MEGDDTIPADTIVTPEEISENQTDSQYLQLKDCEIIKALNGKNFLELPLATQRHLRYSTVRVEIIRKESPKDIKYFLFKRLNRGGSLLSDQEVRNSIVRMGNEKIIDFIVKLSKDTDFRYCIFNLSNKKIEEKYDEELVLRFFAFKNYFSHYVHDIDIFLDEYIEGIAGLGDNQVAFDYEQEENIFRRTFQLLNKALGQTAFSASILRNDIAHFSGFRSLIFEPIALGIQDHLAQLDIEDPEHVARVREKIDEIKTNPGFKRMITGGGKNYPRKLLERINFVKSAFS